MTTHQRAWTALLAGATGALLAAAFALSPARAQVPGPPMTLYGSISDSEGPIPVDTPVQMYVGDTLCGQTKVFYAGEGDAAVALYVGDVVGDEQTKGCGKDDIDVRVKIGDRFADQKAKWRAGLTKLDITFGTATPAPIPTTTPTPTPAGATAPAGETQAPGSGGETPAAGATGTDGSPAASPAGSASPAGTATRTPPGGGVVSSNDNSPGGGGDGGDDGFPVWAAVVLALGGVAVIGGGIGFMMARNRHTVPDEDETTLV